ncbi:MAG: alpha/beta fold hydrolase [bacterium]|nr:MAG: alpha/beta fold hydrolase [bacterium]
MKNALERISQTVWELHKKVQEDPANFEYRYDLLRFLHESRLVAERQRGVARDDHSFLLMQERESLCCLLLHGAGGSPREMRPLGEYLFKMGFTVYALSLPLAQGSNEDYVLGGVLNKLRNGNHRKGDERFKRGTSWSACLSMASIALNTVLAYTSNTYVVGFSFGGTIALNLLENYPIRGAVLISPALVPVRTGRYIVFTVMRKILPFLVSRVAPREDTVIEFMEQTRREIRTIQKPILVVQSAYDPVVSARGFYLLKERAANTSSRFHLIYSRRHVIIDGDESEQVFTLCSDFIKKI